MTSPSTQDDNSTATDRTPAWTTASGTIRKGMKVLAPDGSVLGTVAGLEGEELLLADPGSGQGSGFIALTQVDGVSGDKVLLSDRGDATFGLGAEP